MDTFSWQELLLLHSLIGVLFRICYELVLETGIHRWTWEGVCSLGANNLDGGERCTQITRVCLINANRILMNHSPREGHAWLHRRNPVWAVSLVGKLTRQLKRGDGWRLKSKLSILPRGNRIWKGSRVCKSKAYLWGLQLSTEKPGPRGGLWLGGDLLGHETQT